VVTELAAGRHAGGTGRRGSEGGGVMVMVTLTVTVTELTMVMMRAMKTAMMSCCSDGCAYQAGLVVLPSE
jgi:hypothetical protein